MVKFLRALLGAMLVVVGLVAATPTASAAPPTAPWSGVATGNVASVDLGILDGVDLAEVLLTNSEARASSVTDPRASSISRNLAATVAGLAIEVGVNSQTAPPDNPGPVTGTLVSASALGITTGAVTTSNEAHWAGDASCVVDGPTADTTTTTAGAVITPAGLVNVATTGVSSVRTTTALVSTGGTGLNRAVESQAVGTLGAVSLLGGNIVVNVEGAATLNASADGTSGGADVDYDAPEITLTFNGSTSAPLVPGDVPTVADLGAIGAVLVSMPEPVTTVDPGGLSATATVSALTIAVRVGTAADPALQATVNLLPLTAGAVVPAGGIDCPPPAPAVTAPADGAVIDDSTPTYAGTGTPGATVDLVVDGTTLDDVATVSGAGTWSFTPTAALADGPHTVSATQSLNGTSSVSSAVNDFVVDTDAPDAPAITAPEDGDVLADATPTVTGTGEPGATVTVAVDGEDVGDATVAGDGRWELALDEPLGDGEHTVSAVQTDEAGNESPADEVTFAVDTEALPPVITRPADGSSTTDTTPTIVGTAEPGASVEVSVDGAVVGTVTANGEGAWELPLTEPLAEGDHVVSAVQTDAAGNVSEPGESAFAVDTEAPAAPVITSPEDGDTVTDNTPTIEGTGEPGTTVVVSVDGEPVGRVEVDQDGTWSLILTDPLPDGDYTISAIAVDDAGNESEADEIEFTIDAPGGVILEPSDGPVLADTGGPGLGYLVVGGVLLVVGGTVLSLTRKRA